MHHACDGGRYRPDRDPRGDNLRLRDQLMPREPFTLVGIVGFSPVLDCYPLGAFLWRDLEACLVGHPSVRVENMTWGPLHVVQRFQDPAEPRPDRLVLIGQAPVS